MTFVAARISRGQTSASARSQRSSPSRALGLHARAPERRQPREHDAPVAVRAGALDVAGLGEAVEHLGDASPGEIRAASASSPAESSPRSSSSISSSNWAWLISRAGEVRVAPAHPA